MSILHRLTGLWRTIRHVRFIELRIEIQLVPLHWIELTKLLRIESFNSVHWYYCWQQNCRQISQNFVFPDLTQFRRCKISICHAKTKDFESKSTAENYGWNRKNKYIHKMVVFYVTILEISRRRALNWFWIELQFMPSNWIRIELNKNSLNRTCLQTIALSL